MLVLGHMVTWLLKFSLRAQLMIPARTGSALVACSTSFSRDTVLSDSTKPRYDSRSRKVEFIESLLVQDKHEIDRMTLTMNVELPDNFSPELKHLLESLLQRDVDKRLGCGGGGAEELKNHPFFTGVDWVQVYQQKYPPPLIPPRGEVNAADAFDIGSFDEEDTKGLKLTEADQELYKNFPLVISERWQNEVC